MPIYLLPYYLARRPTPKVGEISILSIELILCFILVILRLYFVVGFIFYLSIFICICIHCSLTILKSVISMVTALILQYFAIKRDGEFKIKRQST